MVLWLEVAGLLALLALLAFAWILARRLTDMLEETREAVERLHAQVIAIRATMGKEPPRPSILIDWTDSRGEGV